MARKKLSHDPEKLNALFNRMDEGIQSTFLRQPLLEARLIVEGFPILIESKIEPIGDAIAEIHALIPEIRTATEAFNLPREANLTSCVEAEKIDLPVGLSQNFFETATRIINEQREVSNQLLEFRSLHQCILEDYEEILLGLHRGGIVHKFRDLPNVVVKDIAGSVLNFYGTIEKIIQIISRRREDLVSRSAKSISEVDRIFLAADYLLMMDEELQEPLTDVLDSLNEIHITNQSYLAFLLGEISELPKTITN